MRPFENPCGKDLKTMGLLLGLLAPLVACDPVGVRTPIHRLQGRQPIDSETLDHIVKDNNVALERYREMEWKYNHGDREQPPDICLAMSGGGWNRAWVGRVFCGGGFTRPTRP